MTTHYQYIDFVQFGDTGKTTIWRCLTRHGDILGRVKWFPGWRQYCFFPSEDISTVFSAGCLADIQAFIGELMAERGRERRQ